MSSDLSRHGMAFTIRSPHGLQGKPAVLKAQRQDYDPSYWCAYAHQKTRRYALFHDYLNIDYTVALWKDEV